MPQSYYECVLCNSVYRGKLYFIQHFGKRHFRGGRGLNVIENYGRIVDGPTPP